MDPDSLRPLIAVERARSASTTDQRGGVRLGLLQVSLAGVLWGSGGLVVTVLHERDGLGAMTASAWRMAVAAVALLTVALLTRRSALVTTLRAHPVLAVTVGCGTAAYQGLYFGSVLLAGITVATVVSLGLAPVFAAAWEHAVAGSRPSPRELVVLVTAIVGLVLVSVASRGTTAAPGGAPQLGLAFAVVSGVVYAATTVLGRTLAQRVDPVALTTCATAAGAVALAPFAVVPLLTGGPVPSRDPTSLALLGYLGVATMALAYGLLYAGLRTTSGSAATVATLVEPLSAAVLAALVLGERVTWTALAGGALILTAVIALRPAEDHPTPA